MLLKKLKLLPLSNQYQYKILKPWLRNRGFFLWRKVANFFGLQNNDSYKLSTIKLFVPVQVSTLE